MAAKEKTSERFNVYSNKIAHAGFDPDRGRIIFSHDSFYKYAIPAEFREMKTLNKIKKSLTVSMFVEKGTSTEWFKCRRCSSF